MGDGKTRPLLFKVAALTTSSDRHVDSGSNGPRASGRFPPLLLVISCAVAAGATWVATRHGPGMSPDSVTYLSAARNLAAGRGFIDFTGQPLTNFPPGFPAALAAGHSFGFSFTASARLINAASFAAVVALAWILLRRHTSSRFVVVGATLLVATSSALVRIADNAWSEPMFCALVLAFLIVLEDATGAAADHRARLLAFAGLLAATAFLVRYAAAALVVVGVLVILMSSRRETWRVILGRLGIFAAAAVSFPMVWVLHNAASGTRALLGPRVPASPGPLSFADRFFTSFLSLFSSSPQMGLIVLGSVAVLGAVAVFTVTQTRHAEPLATVGQWPLVVFVAVYAIFVILSGKFAGASVDARIDAPIYVPALVVAVGLFDRSLRGVGRLRRPRWRRPVVFALVASAVGYLGLSGLSFAHDAWADGQTARGYATPPVQSPLIGAVEVVRPGAAVFTNRPWVLYAATGREPIIPSPGQTAPELSLLPGPIQELARKSCEGPVFLAWFTVDLQWPYPPSELAETVNLEVVARFSEGVLYAVHPKVAPCPGR